MFHIIRFRPVINKKSIRVFSNISPTQPDNNKKFDFGDVLLACAATLHIYRKYEENNYTDDRKEK